MTDEQAERVAIAIQRLAIVVRDEGPEAVNQACYDTFITAGGDCTAALIIAAALIPVDQPVDPWWTDMNPLRLAQQADTGRDLLTKQRARINGGRAA